jgi:hypothetical protein
VEQAGADQARAELAAKKSEILSNLRNQIRTRDFNNLKTNILANLEKSEQITSIIEETNKFAQESLFDKVNKVTERAEGFCRNYAIMEFRDRDKLKLRALPVYCGILTLWAGKAPLGARMAPSAVARQLLLKDYIFKIREDYEKLIHKIILKFPRDEWTVPANTMKEDIGQIEKQIRSLITLYPLINSATNMEELEKINASSHVTEINSFIEKLEKKHNETSVSIIDKYIQVKLAYVYDVVSPDLRSRLQNDWKDINEEIQKLDRLQYVRLEALSTKMYGFLQNMDPYINKIEQWQQKRLAAYQRATQNTVAKAGSQQPASNADILEEIVEKERYGNVSALKFRLDRLLF